MKILPIKLLSTLASPGLGCFSLSFDLASENKRSLREGVTISLSRTSAYLSEKGESKALLNIATLQYVR